MNGVATRQSSKSEGGLASANSALIPRSLLRGAPLSLLKVKGYPTVPLPFLSEMNCLFIIKMISDLKDRLHPTFKQKHD